MLYKLRQFMQGRYGSDQLNFALLCFVLFLSLVNVFAHSWVVFALEILITAFAVYRMLSRKIQTRLRENKAFLGFWNKIKDFFANMRKRREDRKTHVYMKCPSCKAQLRFPRKKGEHGVRCPKCSAEFRVNIK